MGVAEGFFPGGSLGYFSKIFPGKQKWWNLFFPIKTKKQLFCGKFQNPRVPFATPVVWNECCLKCRGLKQWRTQEILMGGLHSVAYGSHLYLVCAPCDVTIWRHIHISKPTFWRSL